MAKLVLSVDVDISCSFQQKKKKKKKERKRFLVNLTPQVLGDVGNIEFSVKIFHTIPNNLQSFLYRGHFDKSLGSLQSPYTKGALQILCLEALQKPLGAL